MSELAPRPSYLYPILPQHDRWAWYERVLTFQADGNSTGVGAARGPGSGGGVAGAWVSDLMTLSRLFQS